MFKRTLVAGLLLAVVGLSSASAPFHIPENQEHVLDWVRAPLSSTSDLHSPNFLQNLESMTRDYNNQFSHGMRDERREFSFLYLQDVHDRLDYFLNYYKNYRDASLRQSKLRVGAAIWQKMQTKIPLAVKQFLENLRPKNQEILDEIVRHGSAPGYYLINIKRAAQRFAEAHKIRSLDTVKYEVIATACDHSSADISSLIYLAQYGALHAINDQKLKNEARLLLVCALYGKIGTFQ